MEKGRLTAQDFPRKMGHQLGGILQSGGRLSAQQVCDYMTSLDIDLETLMIMMLPFAAELSIAPISHFSVGAVAASRNQDGSATLYLGANMEFQKSPLSSSLHAEQAAINHAWLHGESSIDFLATSAAPCGYCRQFLNELHRSEQLQILLPSDSEEQPWTVETLGSLLPNAFGPLHLGVKDRLLAPPSSPYPLQLHHSQSNDPVIQSALQAASLSYAPYVIGASSITNKTCSPAYAGVALQTEDGEIYCGRHAMNAAHNPSLSPLQSALSFMKMSHSSIAFQTITRCVLVETPTLVSQKQITKSILSSIAPELGLEYYLADSPSEDKK